MTWHPGNLMTNSGAPKAGSSPTSIEFNAQPTLHVFYRTFEQPHIIELWWSGGETPHYGYLTKGNGAPEASGYRDPTSHMFDAEGTLHVFYLTTSNHIEELWWSGRSPSPPR